MARVQWLPSHQVAKMSNRAIVLGHIHKITMNIKMAGTHDERYEYIEKMGLLAEILSSVTAFERGLLSDLEVD